MEIEIDTLKEIYEHARKKLDEQPEIEVVIYPVQFEADKDPIELKILRE